VSDSCAVVASTIAFDGSTIKGGADVSGTGGDVTYRADDDNVINALTAALSDNTTRIIRISGVIDFTRKEGITANAAGCIYSNYEL